MKNNITKKLTAALLTVVMLLSAAPLASLGGLDLFSSTASAESYDVFEYSIKDGVVTITDCATTASGEIIIPSTIEGCSVKCIEHNAFYDCKEITSIIIPDSVNEIGDYAFSRCTSLENISFPENIKRIGTCTLRGTAYYNNKHNWKNNALYVGNYLVETKYTLKGDFTIKEGTKTIAEEAFRYTRVTSVSFPDSVENIGRDAFFGCERLKSIKLPKKLKTIEDSLFSRCAKLESVSIPKGVTSIGNAAFDSCTSLKSISIPDTVKTIGDGAFKNCESLKSVKISNSVKTICEETFSNCKSLKSVKIPNSVKTIGEEAFSYCKSLKSVSIPNSVKTIGSKAFVNCTSLKSVTIPKSVTKIGKMAFGYIFEDRDTVYYDFFEHEFLAYGYKVIEKNTNPNYVDSGFKINCYNKSTALKYAKANKIDFKVLDAPKHTHTYKTKSLESSIHCAGYAKRRYCNICGATASNGTIIPKVASVKLSKTKFSCDGKVKKPTVTVTDTKGKKLTLNKDYTVTYQHGRKKPGLYIVVVELIGNYRGQVLLMFVINPAKPTGIKATPIKNGAKVSWNKAAGAEVYQVYYSTEKDGKYEYAGKTSKLSFTVNKLQSNKTYYIKVKDYNVDKYREKFVSGYTQTVKVKVK